MADEQKSAIEIFPSRRHLVPGTSKYLGVVATPKGKRIKFNRIGFPLTSRKYLVYDDGPTFQLAQTYIDNSVKDAVHNDARYRDADGLTKQKLDSILNDRTRWGSDKEIESVLNATILTSNDEKPVILLANFQALADIMQPEDSEDAESRLLTSQKADDKVSFLPIHIAKFISDTSLINKEYTDAILKTKVYPTNVGKQAGNLKDLNLPDSGDDSEKALNKALRTIFMGEGDRINANGNKFFSKLEELVNADKSAQSIQSIEEKLKTLPVPPPYTQPSAKLSLRLSDIFTTKNMGQLLAA